MSIENEKYPTPVRYRDIDDLADDIRRIAEKEYGTHEPEYGYPIALALAEILRRLDRIYTVLSAIRTTER